VFVTNWTLGAAVPVDTSWTFAPIVLLALAGYATVYTLRWRRSRAQGGPRAAGYGRLALWWAGIGGLVLALVSPLDRLGEQLATAHMVQHLLLADLVPILFTLALTKWILRPVTRHVHRIERAAGPFGHPAFGVVAYVGAMWLWHVPALYNAALEHGLIHVLEHLTFAAAGLLYWWHLLSPIRSRLRLAGLGPVLYMASTKILVGFLGVLLAFAPTLLYDFYDVAGTRWGLSPHDDQQVAGLVMALEQSLVMGVALAYLFVRMLAESDAEDQRTERYGAA
jgi:putative membrane protein